MRLLSPFMLALGLLALLIFLLFPRGAPPIAHAQSVAVATITSTHTSTTTTAAAAAAHSLYLPLIHRGPDTAPTPTPSPTPPAIKQRSGIHLGNRGSSDWRIELFEHITSTPGTWPAATVIRSDQLFTLKRETTGLCRITEAVLKVTGEGEPYNAFNYLDAAIKAGTKVVVRVAPSPGNFEDYLYLNGIITETESLHVLNIGDQPAGGDYCDESAEDGFAQNDKIRFYRDIKDVAKEMSEIYTLAVDKHHWPAELLYFEPANEPNYEWYHKYIEQNKPIVPSADNKDAWAAMDAYFAALYDLAKSMESDLQILSPSMSQRLYGEQYLLGSCDPVPLIGGENQGGTDFMTKTFGVDLNGNLITPKADGFAIHNYWREGKELSLPPYFPTAFPVVHWHYQAHANEDPEEEAPEEKKYEPPTHHLLQYMSDSLMDSMSRLPTFITEADLLSNCQDAGNPLQYKDRSPESPYNPERTKQSLLLFTDQAHGRSQTTPTEYGAQFVIVWLLINQEANEATRCATNYEINWHEAYWEDANRVYEREWFPLWWAAAQ